MNESRLDNIRGSSRQPPAQRRYRSAVQLAMAATAIATALPASTADDAAAAQPAGCIAPDVTGVSLAAARGALRASGCQVIVRQLPGHGEFLTPSSPDSRQLVAAQSPRAGGRATGVTISLKPLCAQPAAPGPDRRGPVSAKGPTELVTGLFVAGGPLQTSPQCRHGEPAAGTLTISSPGGRVVSRRSVRAGRYGVFPLKPGTYLVTGVLAGASGAVPPPRTVTVQAHRTTRLNVVADVP